MNTNLIYTSESTYKNLWQKYIIFENYLEFDTLFGVLTIPFEQIESIKIQDLDIKDLLKGKLKLKEFKPALKLDWANFQEHVVLDKTEGFCNRVLFTPQNPEEFKEILEKVLKKYGEN